MAELRKQADITSKLERVKIDLSPKVDQAMAGLNKLLGMEKVHLGVRAPALVFKKMLSH